LCGGGATEGVADGVCDVSEALGPPDCGEPAVDEAAISPAEPHADSSSARSAQVANVRITVPSSG
ncbi:MAG: hypothetical protein ACRDO8_03590, partial [Nocardioidaceae bacterium]